ncbi:ABC transporter ATP-binding protein [Treponema brennaborense]|uniref:Fe(3+)-transporting ATPase n=1 Tax=Treponema brennaborense (strain DSM 12168 / CIP 105900 / DD5/3) TaxID=906968 RepID=F4LJ10_TREBD|nr:ATP-binding cassette domain-containing protein [Treponema brennaborense]AEE17319.1 Fe(3+)-transporting ATPase [Treponema brennaborense DSM 12168]
MIERRTAPDGAPISIAGLRVTRGSKELYRDFSIDFASGAVTALLAPSGGGKTTLLDGIAGLFQAGSGTILAPARVSYLFQEPRLLPWCSIAKNIMLPVEKLLSAREAKERTDFFLEQVGLLCKAAALPAECSGGERQRAALARAFVYPSSVLLMDEAFQSQDFSLKLKLMESAEALLSREKRTVVLVTHDFREALCLADRIVVMTGSPLEIRLDIPGCGRENSLLDRYASPDESARTAERRILDVLCRADAETENS